MSEKFKRFRQRSILESFSSANKKLKLSAEINIMDKNISPDSTQRDLFGAVAEQRFVTLKARTNGTDKNINPDSNKRDLLASAAEQRFAVQGIKNAVNGESRENSQPKSSHPMSEYDKNNQINLKIESGDKNDSQEHDVSAELLSDIFDSEEITSPIFDSEEITSPNDTSNSQEIKNSPLSPNDSQCTGRESSPSTTQESDHLSHLNRSPACCQPLPKLVPSAAFSIMFSPHIRQGMAPLPYPRIYHDHWDSDHIRMPCSPSNKFPLNKQIGLLQSRWDLICQSLCCGLSSSADIERAIMTYNVGKWDFHGLHLFFRKCFTQSEREFFFATVFPKMVEITLNLPSICTQPPPLLKKQKEQSVTLSQKQIGCLLLNAFFCTFPRRSSNKHGLSSEYANYPDMNFNRLFCGSINPNVMANILEKLKCLFNYFERLVQQDPCGTVTFHRQSLQYHPNWSGITDFFSNVVFKSNGLIETDGHGMLQVDFANAFVGGGVLGHGCVQEEIRFLICPELIVSRLFVERLDANEVLIVTGAEQFNKYSGYAYTFKWCGNFVDQTPRDDWGRRCTQVVAMDALFFSNKEDQYKVSIMKREINKAYCGFYANIPSTYLPAIATGNWGCGAFQGDPNLKFLIQLMAATVAGRQMLYFTFGNEKLKKTLEDMYIFLTEKNVTVGDLWRLLNYYSMHRQELGKEKCLELYNYLQILYSSDESSDENEIMENKTSEESNDES